MITQERLLELLHYDPETGVFTRRRTGARAGTDPNAYNRPVRIWLDSHSYRGDHLAFLYMEGTMPPHKVEHINEQKDDNRWCNLRRSTPPPPPPPLVGRCGDDSGWTAERWVGNRVVYLGKFATREEALLCDPHRDIITSS